MTKIKVIKSIHKMNIHKFQKIEHTRTKKKKILKYSRNFKTIFWIKNPEFEFDNKSRAVEVETRKR